MSEAKDFIDITRNPDITVEEKFKGVAFQESEIAQIRENPGKLTKEGVEEKVNLWVKSNNKYTEYKYRAMLKHCKRFEKSGKTADGKTIFSRNADGTADWVSA